MVPLASEFEDLIDVLGGGAKPSGVLILVLNVNFYFKNLLVLVLLFWVRNLYTLAQRMVQSDLLDELLEHSFRDVVVSHSVPCHLQLVEIRFRSDDVRSQWLVVNQMHLQSVVQLHFLQKRLLVFGSVQVGVLLPDQSKTSCLLRDVLQMSSLVLRLVSIKNWVPVVFENIRISLFPCK